MSRDANGFELSPEERTTLSCVLDALVPASRDGALPGAGELDLVGHVEDVLRQQPDLRVAVLQGLGALERLVAERGGPAFGSLPSERRAALLNELATSEPAFLPGLIFHTYTAYYRHPRVLEGLAVEARPPHPLGYELEPGDLALLDPVRERARLHRDAPERER